MICKINAACEYLEQLLLEFVPRHSWQKNRQNINVSDAIGLRILVKISANMKSLNFTDFSPIGNKLLNKVFNRQILNLKKREGNGQK